MDTRELEYHWKQRLSKLDMVNRIHLERVYPFDREYGLSVYASNLETEHFRKIAPESSQPWDDCMKAYVSDNDEHMEKMENYYVATEKDNVCNRHLMQPCAVLFYFTGIRGVVTQSRKHVAIARNGVTV